MVWLFRQRYLMFHVKHKISPFRLKSACQDISVEDDRTVWYNALAMNRDLLERARAVFHAEAAAIAALEGRLDERFSQAVEMLVGCSGRVITTGVGKAGIIAHKVAATLSSTGTPALYLHPAEGVHGDLGVVTTDDVVLALSYSGESDEVVRLLPSLHRVGASLVVLTGNTESTLASAASVVLDVQVESEACPLGLAPTASAAAMLAMGDALAMAAMEARGFTKDDYALYHPAGALGRRLTLRVSDIMRTGDQMAVVLQDRPLLETMLAISKAGAGAAFLVDEAGVLVGLITEGDIRRAIIHDRESLDRPGRDVMIRNPLVIVGDPLAAEALDIFQEFPKPVGDAPVVDAEGRPVGLLMLKDLLRSGIV
jgi:arabinose-5-phosphate isomerase